MNRAFTLVEAVVALAVVGLALAWLVSASFFATESAKVSALRTQAATLGCELARRMQRDGLNGGREGSFAEAPSLRWELSSSPVSDEEGVACRQASLTVSYPDVGHETGSVAFTFLTAGDER